MNYMEVGKMLTIASGFDRRDVDELTITAWLMVPEIAAATYEAGVAAVVAHQSGPHRHEYLTIAHMVDALPLPSTPRSSPDQIEADVRSAKARGIVGSDWPREKPLDPEDAERLAEARRRDIDKARAFEIEP